MMQMEWLLYIQHTNNNSWHLRVCERICKSGSIYVQIREVKASESRVERAMAIASNFFSGDGHVIGGDFEPGRLGV